MKKVAKRQTPAKAGEQIDDLIGQARARRRVEPAACLALAQEALASATALHDRRRTAACRLLCAELHFDLSDYASSCADAAEALAGFEAVGDVVGCIDSQRALGRSHKRLGQDELAKAHLEQALELSLREGEQAKAGYALLSLGHLRHNAGDFGGSIPLYRRALDLAQPLQDAQLQAMAESGLANAFARLGEYARALEYHQRCLKQFDEAHFPRERAFILNNIANVHQALGDPLSAIALHEQSLALKRRLQDRWGEGTSLEALGACHVALGDLDRAQAHFESSLNIAQAIGDREGECVGHQNLGDVALQRGKPQEALRAYQAGLQLSQDLGRRYNDVALLYGKGRALRQMEDVPHARECLEQALNLTDEFRARREQKEIHAELAALFESTHDLAKALDHVKQAFRLEREVFGEDLDTRLRHLKLHFELEKAEQENELHRLRHVELAQANAALERSNAELARANAQKEKLLAALERQKRQLERQSTQDALTGLANRRLFDQELARVFRASKRYGNPLSVVLCDVDNFKAINDRFSHPVGDAVLKTIARLLTKHSRTADLVARYGGEEFALLLCSTPGDQALVACEKMRRVIAEHPWASLHADLVVTISMGIADGLSHEDPAQLVALADKRLYQAKHRGKNCVVLAS
jgi:diguanylate cyclase (GGDEF)-like protein